MIGTTGTSSDCSSSRAVDFLPCSAGFSLVTDDFMTERKR